MHLLSELTLEDGVGVDVIHIDLFIIRLLVLKVESVQRDVVDAVLFGFGRLAVGTQELLILVVPDVSNIMYVKTLFSAFLAVASHVESANKLLLQILGHLLQAFLLQLAHLSSVDFAVFDQLLQMNAHSGIAAFFDIVDASCQQRRHHYVDLCVIFDVDEVSHEIAEFAESLGFFEAQFGEPVTEHRYAVIHINEGLLNKSDKFVPLLSVHDLPDPVPYWLGFVDLLLRQQRLVGQLVPLAELVLIEPDVI
jgi:hypothetical protein